MGTRQQPEPRHASDRDMIEILTVGDELISGGTTDTNAAFIARELYAVGITTVRMTTVGDGPEAITQALTNALPTARFVIVTGGLGPTEDDRTARSAASAFGRNLSPNSAALAAMQDRYRAMRREMPETAKKQAMLPDGAVVVPNPVGTACGFMLEEAGRSYIFLPGVPEEVCAITKQFILGYLTEKIGRRPVIMHRTFKVFGLPESVIQERLDPVLPRENAVCLSYYPQYPEIRLLLTGKGADPDALGRQMDRFQKVLYDAIGDHIYSNRDEGLEVVVGTLLKRHRQTLAVAESCTGGLITHRLTNVPGSSAYLERSVVVYSNQAKQDLLNIPPDMITRHGAVSQPVAGLMASAARERARATYGLAVTGIAGPGGGSAEKPVGTVFIGVADAARTLVQQHHFHGTRQQIKLISSHAALSLLRSIIIAEHER